MSVQKELILNKATYWEESVFLGRICRNLTFYV